MPDDRTAAPGTAAEGADDLLGVLAEEAGAARGDHPCDDELLGYRDGDLDPAAEGRLRDHLVGCRECTERLLDLDALSPDPAIAGGADSEIEVAAAWRDLRAGLAEEAPEAVRRSAASGAAGAPGRWRALQSLAAVLALAVVGLGLWVAQLRRDVDRLAAPQENLPILYLDEPVRATGGAAPRIASPGPGGRVLLIVTPPPDGAAARYRAVVAVEGGREVWRAGDLVPSESGTLRLLLPPRSLPPGRYELRLAGSTGDTSRLLARYRFTVLPEARGPAP
jgi:anti-sigma factor RsiW